MLGNADPASNGNPVTQPHRFLTANHCCLAEPMQISAAEAAGMGLDLKDLLRGRGALENDSASTEPFNWGRDVRDEKAGLTTKAKCALLL